MPGIELIRPVDKNKLFGFTVYLIHTVWRLTLAKRRRRQSQQNQVWQQIPVWVWAGAIIIVVGLGLLAFWPAPNSTPSQPARAETVATPTISSMPAGASTSSPTPSKSQTPGVPTNTPAPALTSTPIPTDRSASPPSVASEETPIFLLTRVAEDIYPPPPPPTATLSITASVSTTSFYTYTIVNSYPHDRGAFTQGLIYQDDIFYESTGLYGRSSLRKVDPQTGQVLQFVPLPAQFFGEGMTVFDDKIIQLTWRSGQGFVYNKDTFELINEFSYPPEGWGLTHDGERLIMSDGTSFLYFRDPDTFEEIDRIQVTDENGPVLYLNELEYINGLVYANIWQTDRIAIIDPETGRVTAWIYLPDILTPEDLSEPVDVLNGIAYDAENDRLFITGKLWPKVFEIQLEALN